MKERVASENYITLNHLKDFILQLKMHPLLESYSECVKREKFCYDALHWTELRSVNPERINANETLKAIITIESIEKNQMSMLIHGTRVPSDPKDPWKSPKDNMYLLWIFHGQSIDTMKLIHKITDKLEKQVPSEPVSLLVWKFNASEYIIVPCQDNC